MSYIASKPEQSDDEETDLLANLYLLSNSAANEVLVKEKGELKNKNISLIDTDAVFTAWLSTVTPANWNTAYSWGNHAGLYLKLDQTTPQSVINGVPYIVNGIKTPKIYPNADSTTAIQFNKANGTTNVLNIDTTNGNVGIGTTGPVEKLSVVGGSISVGSTAHTTYSGLVDLNMTNGTVITNIISYRNGLQTAWGITMGNETVNNLYTGLAGSAIDYFWRANWNTAGVAGNTFQSAANTDNALTVVEILQKRAGNTGDYLHITRNGGTSGNVLTVLNNGNVGIGTTAPGSKLTVSGHLGILGTIPTLTSAGTGASITTGSTDTAGEITEGTSATGAVISFATAYTNVPFAIVVSEAGLLFSYTVSTTGITITNIGALSSTKLSYQVIARE